MSRVRRQIRAGCPIRRFAPAAAAIVIAVGVGQTIPAVAQSPGPLKPVPEAARTEPQIRPSRGRPAGVPREIGQLLDVTEAARASGVMSLRYARRVGNTLYVWVDHLRISIAENDRSDIELDRTNCQILYELIRQNNPSSLLADDIFTFRQQMEQGDRGDPVTAFLRLQLDLEKFRLLYPLHNLNAMTDVVMRLQRDGKRDECLAACDLLRAAVALPNLDGPIQRSFDAYQEALVLLEQGRSGEARRLLRNAANYISHLNVGTYLAESSWYLAKAHDALERDLGGIALASVRDADTLLKNAEERAWKEFKPGITAVRADSRRLIQSLVDHRKKTTLSTADVNALAKRIDAELRIPS
jgi:hypothetical protein